MGDNSAIIVYLLIGLGVILFGVLVGFAAARVWQWPHVTALILVFLTSIPFLFLAAANAKARFAWAKLHSELTNRVEVASNEQERLIYGGIESPDKANSREQLRAKLDRVVVDRGRVWRHCELKSGQAPGPYVLSTAPKTTSAPQPGLPNPALPPNAPAPAAAEEQIPNRIEPNTILHGFLELSEFQGSPNVVPYIYLGEFRVESSTASSIVPWASVTRITRPTTS